MLHSKDKAYLHSLRAMLTNHLTTLQSVNPGDMVAAENCLQKLSRITYELVTDPPACKQKNAHWWNG